MIEIKSKADEVGSYDNKIYMTYDDMVEDQSFKTGKYIIDTSAVGLKDLSMDQSRLSKKIV